MNRISHQDAMALREFFGVGGLSRLEQSPFGHHLDAMTRYGGTRKCRICGGSGWLDGSPRQARKHTLEHDRKLRHKAWVVTQLVGVRVPRKRTGEHLSEYRRLRDEEGRLGDAERYRAKHVDAIQAEAAREDGVTAEAFSERFRSELSNVRAANRLPHDQMCYCCSGTGWVATDVTRNKEMTARSTGSSVSTSQGGVMIQDDVMERLGMVARRLRAMDQRYVEHLARYYAPQSCGVQSLWEFTDAGKKLLRQAAKAAEETGVKMSAWQVFGNLIELERLTSNQRLTDELRECRAQAKLLADDMRGAWLATGEQVAPVRRIRRQSKEAVLASMVEKLKEVMGG